MTLKARLKKLEKFKPWVDPIKAKLAAMSDEELEAEYKRVLAEMKANGQICPNCDDRCNHWECPDLGEELRTAHLGVVIEAYGSEKRAKRAKEIWREMVLGIVDDTKPRTCDCWGLDCRFH